MMFTNHDSYFLRPDLTMLSVAGAGLLLLALILAAAGVSETATENGAMVWLQGPEDSIDVGEEFTVTIRISDVVDLYGLQLELDFDPADLQVIDADSGTTGVQISPAECPADDFPVLNTADNVAGLIEYSVAQLNPTLPVSGHCAVAHVLFQSKREQTTTLDFGETILANRDGMIIPSTQKSLTLRIGEEYEIYLPLVLSGE